MSVHEASKDAVTTSWVASEKDKFLHCIGLLGSEGDKVLVPGCLDVLVMFQPKLEVLFQTFRICTVNKTKLQQDLAE